MNEAEQKATFIQAALFKDFNFFGLSQCNWESHKKHVGEAQFAHDWVVSSRFAKHDIPDVLAYLEQIFCCERSIS